MEIYDQPFIWLLLLFVGRIAYYKSPYDALNTTRLDQKSIRVRLVVSASIRRRSTLGLVIMFFFNTNRLFHFPSSVFSNCSFSSSLHLFLILPIYYYYFFALSFLLKNYFLQIFSASDCFCTHRTDFVDFRPCINFFLLIFSFFFVIVSNLSRFNESVVLQHH